MKGNRRTGKVWPERGNQTRLVRASVSRCGLVEENASGGYRGITVGDTLTFHLRRDSSTFVRRLQ